MSSKKYAFLPFNSVGNDKDRFSLQPLMIFAKCGNCGIDLDVDAPADSESAPITYSCYECELAWDSSGKPQRYDEGGI